MKGTSLHWLGDRPNVSSTGTVVEPTLAQWGLNRSVMPITLLTNSGATFTTLQVTLPAASALATDGNTYVMHNSAPPSITTPQKPVDTLGGPFAL